MGRVPLKNAYTIVYEKAGEELALATQSPHSIPLMPRWTLIGALPKRIPK